MRNATGAKMVQVSLGAFLSGQSLSLNPALLPVWLSGLVCLLIWPGLRTYRLLGWMYLVVFALLALSGTSRVNYLSPAYTWLLAAGGVAIARFIVWTRRAWLRPLLVCLLVLPGLAIVPLGLPVLPVAAYIEWADTLGIGIPAAERHEVGALPQFYADMHGWPEIVATVHEVYAALPPAERARTGIFVFNYGVAGAIDLLGRQYDLPRAHCGHNNYWHWGPPGDEITTLIIVGSNPESLADTFQDVTRVATTDCGYCMPYENNQPVWICRSPRYSYGELWPAVRHYN
jgi:hypothetical protein